MLIRYDDNNQPHQLSQTRHIENLCTSSPCVIATTTTSCIDHHKTSIKEEISRNFLTIGSLNDMTNTRDRNKLQNNGSKGLATTTHLYTAEMKFSKLARNQTTRKLAAWPVERN